MIPIASLIASLIPIILVAYVVRAIFRSKPVKNRSTLVDEHRETKHN